MQRWHTAIPVFLLFVAACSPSTGNDWPPFVDQLIAELEAGPKKNPPGSIWKYNYNGLVVFYIPPSCCDVPGELYTSDGEPVCAPDGGITGAGDGRCPDFFGARTGELLVWADSR